VTFRIRVMSLAAAGTLSAGLIFAGVSPASANVGGGDVKNIANNLCMQGADGVNHSYVTVQACDGADDQKWRAVALNDGTVNIKNNYNQCLGVQQASKTKGAYLVAWRCIAGHLDQEWQPMLDLSNFDTQYFNTNSLLYAALYAGHLSAGTQVVQWPLTSGDLNEDWTAAPVGQ
jgi:hypothetical protein